MAPLTLAELSTYLSENGLQNQVRGGDDVCITGCNTLEDAREGELTFLANPKYRDQIAETKASAIIMQQDDSLEPTVPQIVCDDPYRGLTMAVIRIHGYRNHPQWGISDRANIAETASVGPGANIAAGATISDHAVIGREVVLYPGAFVGPGAQLGDNVVLYPNVTVYDGCELGDRVTVHAGTVIGEDGLGYAPVGDKWLKIPQVGMVVVEDDVELGANCTVDRATLGLTRIGSGTKFSNLVAVGHGSKIGSDCMIVAQVGLAGSVNVGRHVTIAGQAGIVGHLSIGDNAVICAQSGVSGSVAPGHTVLGSPAVEVSDARRQMAAVQKLPEMKRRIRALERELEQLKMRLDGQVSLPDAD